MLENLVSCTGINQRFINHRLPQNNWQHGGSVFSTNNKVLGLKPGRGPSVRSLLVKVFSGNSDVLAN